MRIISGIAGRRPIKVPQGVARPTTDRTREALFSILGDLVKGAKVLDLFAGSGALGLEALSRGAESCVFVDADRGSVRTIKENITTLGLKGASVIQADAMHYTALNQFDVIFADPPYWKKTGDRDFVVELLGCDPLENCSNNAYFIAEGPAGRAAPANASWQLVAERSYGSCGISIYQKQSDHA